MQKYIVSIITLTSLVISSAKPCMSQIQHNSSTDMQLLLLSKGDSVAERTIHYGFGNRLTINPFYHLLASSMYLYQRLVSPVLSRSCAFTPTCSAYSKALIKEYGLVKGTICTADRLSRCNRISMADRSTYRQIDPNDGHIHETVERYRLKEKQNKCHDISEK